MKTISVMLLVVFILSVALLVVTFRKPKRVSVLSLVLAVFMSFTTLIIFSILINYHPSIWLLAVMVAAGLIVGIIWSQTTRIYIEDGKVMSRNSVWYLVVWGGIFTLTQLVSIVTNKPPAAVMALLIMSTASVAGMNGRIIGRYFGIKAKTRAVNVSVHYCPQCGFPAGNGNIFCSRCGNRL